jgi:membrane fusion protein YbhG
MKKFLIPAAAAVVVVVVALTWLKARSHRDPNRLRLSGNIEVIDVEVSFKIPGRVESRPVDEGQTIEQGATVATLERAELTRDVALRKAELASAQARLAELTAGSRPEEVAGARAAAAKAEALLAEMEAGSRPSEIAAAEAAARRARADATWQTGDFQRSEELFKKETISQRQLDDARAARDMATSRLEEAEARLALVKEGPRKEEIEQARQAVAEARERSNLVKAGPRQEAIDDARARAAAAAEALAISEIRLGHATLLSPLGGVVLTKAIEPGEYVAAGTPVVTVAELARVWLRGYIDETDLGRIKLGQEVRVTTDTYPGKSYPGRLSFISSQAEFTPRNVQTEKERVKLVYRVKIDIPNPDLELKPGMPADGEILLGESR